MSALSPELQGDLLVAHKKYVEAIREYQQGPQNSAVLWNKMGIAYHHVFALAEAKKDYQKAIQLNPKYGDALNNLGTVAYAEKNYHLAEKLYKRALKLSSDPAPIYGNLGTAYFADGKQRQGAEAYRQALKLDPTVFDHNSPRNVEEQGGAKERGAMSYYLATTYAEAGMRQQALQALRMALLQGYADRRRITRERAFASLLDMPEFQQLVAQSRKP